MLRTVLAFIVSFGICNSALAEDAKERATNPHGSIAVKLSDAELDDVYAGAFTLLILNNPGNDNTAGFVTNHFGCNNECGGPTQSGTTGLHIVVTRNNVIVRCMPGGCP